MNVATMTVQCGGRLFLPDECFRNEALSRPAKDLSQGNPPFSAAERPWGFWQEFAKNEQCTIRILVVHPKKRLSDQRHQQRDEMFAILDPGTAVDLDGNLVTPSVGDFVFIPRNTWHRLICAGEIPVRVLEVAFGHYGQENDIERRHDDFGRKLIGERVGAE